MLNIKTILDFVHRGVATSDARFLVMDDEHVKDTKTGVEFHLYDDGGKITHDEKIIAKVEYFTEEEKAVLFEIKKLITDPAIVAKKLAHYPVMIKEARATFSGLFEKPNPPVNKEPAVEPNTQPYRG